METSATVQQLTPRENFIETVEGGHPDRLVRQFEFMDAGAMFADPLNATNGIPFFPGDVDKVDYWGVTWMWPASQIGAFPVQDAAHKVLDLDDVCDWDRVLTSRPPAEFDDAVWEEARQAYDAVDRTQLFVGPMVSPGVFETLHSIMGMDDAMVAFYEEPEAMHELIDCIVDWECGYARQMGENLHPDILFHHDDWGSKDNTFMSTDMFDEFLLKPYQRLYQAWRDAGARYVIHHSDSYAQTLVPEMVQIGIDVWQGGVKTNDLRGVIDTYGDKLTVMSGIESAEVDVADWSDDSIQSAVDAAVEACGVRHYIPCQTQGGPASTFPGVYEAISEAIGKTSERVLGR